MTRYQTLATMIGVLRGMVDSLDCTYESCPDCEAKRYHNWHHKKIVDNLQAAITKLMAAVELIRKGAGNDEQ